MALTCATSIQHVSEFSYASIRPTPRPRAPRLGHPTTPAPQPPCGRKPPQPMHPGPQPPGRPHGWLPTGWRRGCSSQATIRQGAPKHTSAPPSYGPNRLEPVKKHVPALTQSTHAPRDAGRRRVSAGADRSGRLLITRPGNPVILRRTLESADNTRQ